MVAARKLGDQFSLSLLGTGPGSAVSAHVARCVVSNQSTCCGAPPQPAAHQRLLSDKTALRCSHGITKGSRACNGPAAGYGGAHHGDSPTCGLSARRTGEPPRAMLAWKPPLPSTLLVSQHGMPACAVFAAPNGRPWPERRCGYSSPSFVRRGPGCDGVARRTAPPLPGKCQLSARWTMVSERGGIELSDVRERVLL